jgi:hypothetical protein
MSFAFAMLLGTAKRKALFYCSLFALQDSYYSFSSSFVLLALLGEQSQQNKKTGKEHS